MMDLESRLTVLEERFSALECRLKSGKEKSDEICDSWTEVILEFADTFGLNAKELREKYSTQKESQT